MKTLVFLASLTIASTTAWAIPTLCPQTIVVTTVANAGPGSLRQAILDANECPGTNRIVFNIITPPPHTIIPVGGLPAVTAPVIIDGFNQGAVGNQARVEINGALSPTSFGLQIQTSNSHVHGLVINGFPAPGGNGYGILIAGPSAVDNWVSGCFLGTDASGTVARPNGQGGVWVGLGAARNLIGSNGDGVNDEAERNIISGNTANGVLIQGNRNVVAGNYIGTDVTGSAAVANRQSGIFLNNAAENVIANNLISGNGVARFNGGNGIFIRFANAAQNVVIGNRIGTSADGGKALPNTTSGIALSSGAHDNRIGTDGDGLSDAAERNLISGNGNDGITIGFVIGDAPVLRTIVAGNYIGTDITGTAAIPNLDSAVFVLSGEGHRIGTDANGIGDEAERNVLSGNGQVGVTLDGVPGPSSGVTIAGNFIGTDASGNQALGNRAAGVLIIRGASGNHIGGASAAAGNRIAYNGNGVVVGGGAGNRILSNSIYRNTNLGIDLGADGASANDPGDVDAGPNNLQNTPVLAPVNRGGMIAGALHSRPNQKYLLQFFANAACATPSAGEGEVLVASAEVTTGSSGAVDFSIPYSLVPGKTYLTATATSSSGDTSEFSPCVLGNSPPVATPQTVATLEDAEVVISLQGTDADNDPLEVSVSTLPANGGLFQFDNGSAGPAITTVPAVVTDPDGRVIYAPSANGNGAPYASFNFVADDGAETSAPAAVTINVVAVNDPPMFAKGADQEANEDAGPITVGNWANNIASGPPDENDPVMFMVSVDQPQLFGDGPAMAPNGTLSFTPAVNAHGTATVTVRLQDMGGTANGGADVSEAQTFLITILPVNDAPSFERGADVTVLEDAGAQTIAGWASAIAPGPRNEDAQLLHFEVVASNPNLFSSAPQIDPGGTLRFTPAQDAHGSSTLTIHLVDDGGVERGGQDRSLPATALVTVTPVNDCAVAVPQEASGDEDHEIAVVLSGTDVDGDAMTFAVTVQPAHGTLAGTPPNLVYTPAANYCGEDRFEFSVTDGNADCAADEAVVVLRVKCINDCPTADIAVVPPAAFDEQENVYVVISGSSGLTTVLFDGTGSSDIEDDALTYEWQNVTDPLAPVTFGDAAVAGTELAVGLHTITLTVADQECTGSAAVVIEVISPAEALARCIALVEGSDLDRKQKRPLIDMLLKAVQEFEREKLKQAIDKLEIFDHKLSNDIERGRISAEDAAPIADCVRMIIDAVQQDAGR